MSTISSVTPLSFNGYIASATDSAGSLVARTNDLGMVQTAASLSAEAGVVAMLGGGASSPVTYDAAGLLNVLVQAGSAPLATQAAGNGASPQASAGSPSPDPATSGIYDSSGSLNSLPSNVSADWAGILKANPSLASLAITDSFDQGIVGTLSTAA